MEKILYRNVYSPSSNIISKFIIFDILIQYSYQLKNIHNSRSNVMITQSRLVKNIKNGCV